MDEHTDECPPLPGPPALPPQGGTAHDIAPEQQRGHRELIDFSSSTEEIMGTSNSL